MKKILLPAASFLFAGLLALHSHSAEAKVWNVGANFANAQAAHNDSRVVSGDTLYFNGSSGDYGSLTLTKKLVIMGPGFFLGQNPETQVSQLTAVLTGINFNAGSAGSEVQGMTLSSGTIINADNVVVKRNYFPDYCGYVSIGGSRSNIFLNQNYFDGGNGCSGYLVSIGSSCTNIFIFNNYFDSYGTGVGTAINSTSASAIQLGQNVFATSSINTNNSVLYNNIMTAGTVSGNNNSFNNNLGNGTQFPAGNGNQQNVNMTNVFVGTGSNDGKWQLKTGSPAIGAGINGTEDCGMFGGNDPYVLSGLPPIPAIWFFTQPSSVPASGTLQVQLKAKSHN